MVKTLRNEGKTGLLLHTLHPDFIRWMEAHTGHCATKLIRYKKGGEGFPGGAVVKNPPANTGDTGRSHMPRSN